MSSSLIRFLRNTLLRGVHQLSSATCTSLQRSVQRSTVEPRVTTTGLAENELNDEAVRCHCANMCKRAVCGNRRSESTQLGWTQNYVHIGLRFIRCEVALPSIPPSIASHMELTIRQQLDSRHLQLCVHVLDQQIENLEFADTSRDEIPAPSRMILLELSSELCGSCCLTVFLSKIVPGTYRSGLSVLEFPPVARRDLTPPLKGHQKSVVRTSDISDVGEPWMVACMRLHPASPCWSGL